MNPNLVTAPSALPVSVAEMRNYLKLDLPDEDDQLEMFIEQAVDVYQEATGWQLMSATYDYTLDDFPAYDGTVILPKPPLTSITSITYLDDDGASQTMSSSDYRVITSKSPGRVQPAYNVTWPTTRNLEAVITIRYVCGFASAAAVPDRHKIAVKFLAGHYYENRNTVPGMSVLAELPWSVRSLINNNRIKEVA